MYLFADSRKTRPLKYRFLLFYTLLDSLSFNCADYNHYDVYNNFKKTRDCPGTPFLDGAWWPLRGWNDVVINQHNFQKATAH